jgi:hypothetical protein
MKNLGTTLVVLGISLIALGAVLKLDNFKEIKNEIKSAVEGKSPQASGTPFVAGSWETAPFTGNDNRTAPLLWSIKFAVPKKRGCVSDAVGKMYVSPGTVVFVKVADKSGGTFTVGTTSERRTVNDTGKWLAARFVEPSKREGLDIPVTKREQFVICDATENMIAYFEARRLPKK